MTGDRVRVVVDVPSALFRSQVVPVCEGQPLTAASAALFNALQEAMAAHAAHHPNYHNRKETP